MARVVVTQTAQSDLGELIRSRKLPASTSDRVRAQLRTLTTFPLLGRELEGSWAPLRAILGPWPWMLIVYDHDPRAGLVTIVTIADTRTAAAPR